MLKKKKSFNPVFLLYSISTVQASTHTASPVLDNPFKTVKRKVPKNDREIAHKFGNLETGKQSWRQNGNNTKKENARKLFTF